MTMIFGRHTQVVHFRRPLNKIACNHFSAIITISSFFPFMIDAQWRRFVRSPLLLKYTPVKLPLRQCTDGSLKYSCFGSLQGAIGWPLDQYTRVDGWLSCLKVETSVIINA